ncbi:YrhK family protein [Saccharopolyspora sp. NPDC050642]|uniref:YrhK family protein n=1 Tax=Saccharopolyspora sp. NPDC050642 TaxID=3157099 RepID=UPI003406F2BB
MRDPAESGPFVLRIGREELLIRRRYEVISIVNDFLIAVWFAVGSLLFFHESTVTAGTWLFLLGSCELAVRPVIRLARHVRLRRLRPAGLRGSDQDF